MPFVCPCGAKKLIACLAYSSVTQSEFSGMYIIVSKLVNFAGQFLERTLCKYVLKETGTL